MPEELKIIIQADVEQARAGLNSVATEADKTAGSLNKIPSAANSASAGLDKVAASSTSIAPATNVASSGVQKMVSNLVKLPPLTNTSAESTKKLVKQLQDTSSVLVKVASGTPGATQQITKLQLGVSKLGDSLETLKAKAAVTKDFINTEKDTTKVALLNKQLQELEAEILRVQAIGRTPVNIAPTVDTSALITGAQKAFGAIRQLAFILPGVGIAGIIGALSDSLISLGKELFNVGESFDKAGVQAANFQNQLKNLDDFIDATKGDLDFSAEIDKLKAQLKFGPGFESDIIGKTIDIDAAKKKFENLTNILNTQTNNLNNLLNNAHTVLSKAGQQLFDVFGGTPSLISDELIQKLTKNDQTFLNNAKALSASIEKINKERGDLDRQIQLLDAQKQVEINNETLRKQKEAQDEKLRKQKEAHDKQLKEQQDFIERTIALAKAAKEFFNIPINLEISKFDQQADQFKKALATVQGIKDFTIKMKTDIEFPEIKELPREQVDKLFKNIPDAFHDAIEKGLINIPEDKKITIGVEVGPFSKEIQDTIDQFNKNGFVIPVTFELKDADLLATLKTSFSDFQNAVDSVKKISFASAIDSLERLGAVGKEAGRQTELAFLNAGKTADEAAAAGQAIEHSIGGITEQAAEAARVIDALLTPAFQDLFQSILEGKDPLKAFFDSLTRSVEQLISKLIAAAVQAAILSLIPGAGSFSSLFGALFREKGGPVEKGKPYIVGEKGYELFVPQQSGTIISHDKLIRAQSVRDHEAVREYLANRQIAESIKAIETRLTNIVYKISEQSDRTNKALVERFTTHSDAINKFVQTSITATNDRTIEAIRYITKDKSDSTKEVINSYKLLVSDIAKSDKITETVSNKEFYSTVRDQLKEVIYKTTNNSESQTSKLETITSTLKSFTDRLKISVTNNIFASNEKLSVEKLHTIFKIPKFAEGGFVFGPTLGILGEGFGISRSNPEVVAPLNQLKSILGGEFAANININGNFDFGNGLTLAISRIMKSNLRTTGRTGL